VELRNYFVPLKNHMENCKYIVLTSIDFTCSLIGIDLPSNNKRNPCEKKLYKVFDHHEKYFIEWALILKITG
jgi:hypothetical protein